MHCVTLVTLGAPFSDFMTLLVKKAEFISSLFFGWPSSILAQKLKFPSVRCNVFGQLLRYIYGA